MGFSLEYDLGPLSGLEYPYGLFDDDVSYVASDDRTAAGKLTRKDVKESDAGLD